MLPPFPMAVTDALGGAGQALASEPLLRGQIILSGTAEGAIENRQVAGNRDSTSAGQWGTPGQHLAPPLNIRSSNVYI